MCIILKIFLPHYILTYRVTGVSSLQSTLQGQRVLKGCNDGTTRVEWCYVWITMTTKMLQMVVLLFSCLLAHNFSPHLATPSDVPLKLRRHAHETHIQMRSCVMNGANSDAHKHQRLRHITPMQVLRKTSVERDSLESANQSKTSLWQQQWQIEAKKQARSKKRECDGWQFLSCLVFPRKKTEEKVCSWEIDLQLTSSTCFFEGAPAATRGNTTNQRVHVVISNFFAHWINRGTKKTNSFSCWTWQTTGSENENVIFWSNSWRKKKRSSNVEAGVTLSVTEARLLLWIAWNWPFQCCYGNEMRSRDYRVVSHHTWDFRQQSPPDPLFFFLTQLLSSFHFSLPKFWATPSDVTLPVRGERCCWLLLRSGWRAHSHR